MTTSEVVAMIQQSGLTDKQFKFFESDADFMARAAKTPRSNCVLDSTKAVRHSLELTPSKKQSTKR